MKKNKEIEAVSYFDSWVEWVKQRKNKEIGTVGIPVDNSLHVIDSRDIEKKIIELKKELVTLIKLENDYFDKGGEIDEWANGINLVYHDFFSDYTKILAAKHFNMDMWPASHIDWNSAVEDLKKDYFIINYKGATYWTRKPA